MSKEKQTFDLATLDPLTLPELQGWKEKQEAIVKENPFVEVVDNATYEDAKKHRTALVSARTSIEKQDKLIASKLKEVRTKVSETSKELIEITLPHETKQQEEVRKYEAIKEAERAEKAEKERQRVQAIKDAMEHYEIQLENVVKNLKFEGIEKVDTLFNDVFDDILQEYNFQEFEELFTNIATRVKSELQTKKEVLKKEEAQRLENERLKKEAEENAKKAREAQEKLEAERKEMQLQIEEREKEEAKRQARIEADKQKLELDKEEIRKLKERENKISARIKRLVDELKLKFDFQDSFVGEDGMNVSVVEVKTLSDDEFDSLIQKCLDFKNRPQIEENSVEMTNGDVLPLSDKFLENIEVIEPSMVDVNEAFPATDEMMEVDFEEPEIDKIGKSNAEKAIKFLNDRKGFDDWWYNLDMEIQQEILVELSKIIG